MRYLARRSTEEQLAHDFALLDSDGKGFIDASDLQRIGKSLPPGVSCTDADIAAMLQLLSRAGTSKDKPMAPARVNFDQFSAAVGCL